MRPRRKLITTSTSHNPAFIPFFNKINNFLRLLNRILRQIRHHYPLTRIFNNHQRGLKFLPHQKIMNLLIINFQIRNLQFKFLFILLLPYLIEQIIYSLKNQSLLILFTHHQFILKTVKFISKQGISLKITKFKKIKAI